MNRTPAKLHAKYFVALLNTAQMEVKPDGTIQFQADERLAALLRADSKRRPDVAKRILDDVLSTSMYRLLLQRAALQERIDELSSASQTGEDPQENPLEPPAAIYARHQTRPVTPPLPASPALTLLEPTELEMEPFDL